MIARRKVKCVVTAMAMVAVCAGVRAELPRDPPAKDDSLQIVFDRIREHAKDESWRKEGWKDELIEQSLNQFVAAVAKATETPDLKLPVRQADVQPADLARFGLPRALLICKDTPRKLFRVQHSIILADGNVDVSGPEDSVIVARGFVNVSRATNCVIVSARHVIADGDGNRSTGAVGSLIVSRGVIDLRLCYGSILIAGRGVTAQSSEGAIFVNSPVPQTPLHRNSRSVTVQDMQLEALPLHPLGTKITLLGSIQQSTPIAGGLIRPLRDSGVLFRYQDRRYVAELDQPIVDEAGKPVEALTGWKLALVNDNLAIFGHGDEEAVVRREEK